MEKDEKMFLKKLMCLILSLIFSLSSILTAPLTFSFDASDFFDWSRLDPDNLDEGAEDALEISRGVVEAGKTSESGDPGNLNFPREAVNLDDSGDLKFSSETASVNDFIDLWNLIVEKYVFGKCGFKNLSFESSGICLTEELLYSYSNDFPYVVTNLTLALYSLTEKLINNRHLCEEDFENIRRAHELAKFILTENGIYNISNIFSRDFNGETWDSFINLSVARSIYRKILEFCTVYNPPASTFVPFGFINASAYTVLFDSGKTVDFDKNEMHLNFDILWNSVMGCFVFDKISGFQEDHRSFFDLNNLNTFYVCLLHEFAIKLKACNRLYPVEYLPFLSAAIELTEELAKDYEFDLPDNFIGELSNTNWSANKTEVEKTFDFIKKQESSAFPAKRTRYY